MKPTDFTNALTDFLGHYLTVECEYSRNTVTTYSYTCSLLYEQKQTLHNARLYIRAAAYEHDSKGVSAESRLGIEYALLPF